MKCPHCGKDIVHSRRMPHFDFSIRSGIVEGELLTLDNDIPKYIIEMSMDLKRLYGITEDDFVFYSVRTQSIGQYKVIDFFEVKSKGSLPHYLKRALKKLGIEKLPDPSADFAHQS